MFFKNLSLFRFAPTLAPEKLEDALDGARLRACGPLEQATMGFVSPYGRGHDTLVVDNAPFQLLTLGSEEKLLPSSVINEVLADRIEAQEAAGRSVGRKERLRLKDEVLTELLPRAFSRPGRLSGYIDRKAGWVVIDSASDRAAEDFVSAIREAVGSFPVQPASAGQSPRTLLTHWLNGGELPSDLVLGDECELRDPSDEGAIVRCRRQDLTADEVTHHLRSGKEVFQLALTYDDRISFVLGEDMKVRKLRFLDSVVDSLENADRESAAAELDAVFALMSLELERLLQRLDEIFELALG